MLKSLSTVAIAVSLVACASAQKAEIPASVPAVAVQKQMPVAHPYALPEAQARVMPQAPGWFVNLPKDTADMVFAAGTATSTDEQMAYDKARKIGRAHV